MINEKVVRYYLVEIESLTLLSSVFDSWNVSGNVLPNVSGRQNEKAQPTMHSDTFNAIGIHEYVRSP